MNSILVLVALCAVLTSATKTGINNTWGFTSVTVNLWNNSTQVLNSTGCTITEGIYDLTPNGTVAIGQTIQFKAESNGDGSTTGACQWAIGPLGLFGTLGIAFHDPLLGENSFQIVVNPGTYFTVSYTGGTGWQTTVNVALNTWHA